jgi:hypothetical protein
MKHLKKFEGFTNQTCDRCGQKTNTMSMSWLNTDECCMDCLEAEKDEPDYILAKERESEEVRRGNYNYGGIRKESNSNDSHLHEIAQSFLDEYSQKFDLRLGEQFDSEFANCAWFTKEFNKWCFENSIPVQIVYFDSNSEAHTASLVDNKVIDFTVKQFTKNPQDDYKIMNIEDYKKWGYPNHKILRDIPEWYTIKAAKTI